LVHVEFVGAGLLYGLVDFVELLIDPGCYVAIVTCFMKIWVVEGIFAVLFIEGELRESYLLFLYQFDQILESGGAVAEFVIVERDVFGVEERIS
jgi:hypothetical protein